jgi:hypothetical protein
VVIQKVRKSLWLKGAILEGGLTLATRGQTHPFGRVDIRRKLLPFREIVVFLLSKKQY